MKKISALVFFTITALMLLTGCTNNNEKHSVAMIGGADGPTEIYIAQQKN